MLRPQHLQSLNPHHRWDISFTKSYKHWRSHMQPWTSLKFYGQHSATDIALFYRGIYVQYYSYSNLLELVRSITCPATCTHSTCTCTYMYMYYYVAHSTAVYNMYACANGQSHWFRDQEACRCHDGRESRDKTVGQLQSRSFFMRFSFFTVVKMNSVVYAWLCSLTVAFGGFMWGYEVG